MPKYETMLITSGTLDEEATAAVVGKFKSLIEANGTIEAVEEWGRRRFAYEINKQNDGVYTLIHFESGPDFPAELDRVYKITDGVVRSLIVARAPGQELSVKPAPPVEAAPAQAFEPAAAKAEEPKAEAAPAEEAKAEEPKAEEAPAAETAEPAEEAKEEA